MATDTPERVATGEMRVLGRKGDTRITWNARDADEVDAAKRQFKDLTRKNFLAFNVTPDGSRGEQMSDFDPQAQKVILVPPMAGGARLDLMPQWSYEITSRPVDHFVTVAGYRDDTPAALPLVTAEGLSVEEALENLRHQAHAYDRAAALA